MEEKVESCISYGIRLVVCRLSLRLSGCLSHAGTVSKRRKLGSRNLHRQIAQADSSFRDKKVHPEIRKRSPRARSLNKSGVRETHNIFSQ